MTPRKIHEVIDRVLPFLREAGIDASGLTRIQESAGFTAPEMMRSRWEEAQFWLARNVPTSSPAYAPTVAIWRGEA